MNKQFTVKYKFGGEVITSNEKENNLYRLDGWNAFSHQTRSP